MQHKRRLLPAQQRLITLNNFKVFLGSYLVITSSLLFGSFFGDSTGVLPPTIGVYALLTGLIHILPLYIVLTKNVRINPYVSLAELLYNRGITPLAFLFEVIAQALGATAAAGTVYGILSGSPLFIAGLGGTVTNASVGWALFIKIFAGTFIVWAYFKDVNTLIATIATTSCIVYPFVGTTTHNPFRWLSACVVEGACGSTGSWVFPVGPLIGVALGCAFVYISTKMRVRMFI